MPELMAHHEPAKPMKAGAAMNRTSSTAPVSRSGKMTTSAPNGPGSPVRARFSPKPAYPPEARRLGQQGRVVLEVQIGADGRVTSASVKHSSGFPLLDSAAVQGVLRWTFEPARVTGLPVASRAEVPVSFSFAQ
jgi:protein TonB